MICLHLFYCVYIYIFYTATLDWKEHEAMRKYIHTLYCTNFQIYTEGMYII